MGHPAVALALDIACLNFESFIIQKHFQFRLHLTEGSFGSTPGYTVSSLTSTSDHLNPNPITKHEGATFFSGEPVPPPPPPPPPRIVVGAEAVAPAPERRQNIVVGHTGGARKAPEAPAAPVR